MKALCIGHSAYNLTNEIEKLPEENAKINYNNTIESGGGCAATIAYTLGKYGVDTYIGSVVGDDTFGQLIKKGLEKVGVHTEYMETAYEKRTNMAFILANKVSKNRTIMNIEKEPLLLKKTEYQIDPDIVIVDGYDYGASLSALNKYSKKITMIDAGEYSQEVLELCKYCHYIVASKEFSESVTGQKINFDNPQSLVYVYSTMINKFPNKEIIITLGEKGAMYMTSGQIKVMPPLNVNVVDKTGAGDIFHGAFAYALLKNYDMEQSVTFASIAAGLSIDKVGAWNSVSELSDIMNYFNQKYGIVNNNNVQNQPVQNNTQIPPVQNTPSEQTNVNPQI